MLTVRVGVKDLDREVKFYEALGFEVERRQHGANVLRGEASFSIEHYEEFRVRDGALLDWEQRPSQLGTGVQLYVIVPNVDEVAANIPVGIPRPWPVQDKPWGLRELTLKTPSGYLLTFAQRRR